MWMKIRSMCLKSKEDVRENPGKLWNYPWKYTDNPWKYTEYPGTFLVSATAPRLFMSNGVLITWHWCANAAAQQGANINNSSCFICVFSCPSNQIFSQFLVFRCKNLPESITTHVSTNMTDGAFAFSCQEKDTIHIDNARLDNVSKSQIIFSPIINIKTESAFTF
jgi:hypothetical protein